MIPGPEAVFRVTVSRFQGFMCKPVLLQGTLAWFSPIIKDSRALVLDHLTFPETYVIL